MDSQADEIIVEGDDELLELADSWVAGASRSAIREAANEGVVQAATYPVGISSLTGLLGFRASLLGMLVPVLLVLGFCGYSSINTRHAAPHPSPTTLPTPHEQRMPNFPDKRLDRASDVSGTLAPYIWPAIIVLALVLMYLLARQAIAAGSNVSLEWKVTEKVHGKLKITRTAERGRRT
ncbi:hypothetical protein [Sphingomonas changbaiensis]|uniref:hypothetical protein n=1 Tax=Sphingomonas changbaiensis TaxID=529705 RepID=UPI00061D3ADA|nr:hypothetical protein [Sphingomonas changbaiensis]